VTAADDTATARLRTGHRRPAVVAAAVAPDNTSRIETRIEDDRVVTTVGRADVAGLRATVQDYLRSLDAADRTVQAALSTRGGSDAPTERTRRHTHTDSPINEDTQTTDDE
jgi:tRNA threonylcarbamoyladenosine modification (KEOPS) complex  Pcc1 subunit